MFAACLTNSSKKLSSRGTSRSRQRGTSRPLLVAPPESCIRRARATNAIHADPSVHELVAETPHGDEVGGPVWVLFHLAPQALHVDVERPRVPEVVRPPDLVDQGFTGEQTASAA